jgi:hypothetical protein
MKFPVRPRLKDLALTLLIAAAAAIGIWLFNVLILAQRGSQTRRVGMVIHRRLR